MTVRQATGLPAWPFILLEGHEKTGKTYQAIKVASDPRLGHAFYVGVGEVSMDEYGSIAGDKFHIIDHNGSYREIRAAVEAIVKLPVDLAKPHVAIFDSGSMLWDLLSNEADAAARKGADSEASITITPDKWNTAKSRWKAVIDPLLKWPGLVIVTARGEETIAMDDNGRPAQDNRKRAIKTYKIQGHKSLPYDAQVIVRCTAPGQAILTGCKSLQLMVPEDGLELPEFDLMSLLLNGMKLGGHMAARQFTSEKLASTVPIKDAQGQLVAACQGDAALAKQLWEMNEPKMGIEDGLVQADILDGLLDYARDRIRTEGAVPADKVREAMKAVLADDEACKRIWSEANPPEGEDVPKVLANQLVIEARRVAAERQAQPAVAPEGDQSQVRESPAEVAAGVNSGALDPSALDPAQPDEVSATVEDPPAPHPADSQLSTDDAPTDDQKLEAFITLVNSARDAGQLGLLQQLRSRVTQLPNPVKKAASEAVTAAKKAVEAASAQENATTA